MPEDKCRPLNWDKIHNFVVEKSNAYLEGIGKGDVDWFLTDSKVKVEPKANAAAEEKTEDSEKPELKKETLSNLLVTPPSPHFQVSNSNSNSTNKTKPTVLPVTEEPAQSDSYLNYAQSYKQNSPVARRRSSVSSVASSTSAGSISSASGSGGGFFSKLKNKLHRTDSQPSSPVIAPQVPIPERTLSYLRKSSVSTSIGDQSYLSDSKPPFTGPGSSPSPFKAGYQMNGGTHTPVDSKQANGSQNGLSEPLSGDPRLDEYVRFYKLVNHSKGLGGTAAPKTHTTMYPNSCISNYEPSPTRAPELAPAAGKIGSLFRRMSVISNTPSQDNMSPQPKTLMDSSLSLQSTAPTEVIPQFKNIKKLRRVAFHSLTFLIDPPQQIPSRTPRQGNVEVLPSGVVRINPLTEADKAAIEKLQKGLGGGLVVGGTGALGLSKDHGDEQDDEEELNSDQDSGKDSNGEKDTEIDKHAKLLAIDKPMMHSVARPGYTVPVKKMALDLMYTRCCHLREILPIPAIAKQIPKGSMAPLPILQLRNPTPTMIEIQTFADFIRIAPIICISLDGVLLSYDQLKILLSAMCAKKQLEKLSLRNTPIDAKGWSLLCWFLSRNTVLNKLDITQCPPLSVNVLKKKKKKPEKKGEDETIVRMTCNKENRSDMDWALFTATIIARGGIEELILTGCCITDLSIFDLLMSRAVTMKTYKLGLAYNQLTPQQLRIVLESWVLSTLSRGLDLGYNDFLAPSYLNLFLELSKTDKFKEMIPKSRLGFLSLNATNLHFNELFKEFQEKFLISLPNLKYLDISNNPKLFGVYSGAATSKLDADDKSGTSSALSSSGTSTENGGNVFTQEAITSYFCSKLPLFKSLIRLHLENNSLSPLSLKNLFETVPFCKNLAFLSVLGNTIDIEAASALILGLENSKSLMTVDGDFNQLPEVIKERIGLYTMRNMEALFKQNIKASDDSGTATTTLEANSIATQEESIAEKLSQLLLKKDDEKFDLTSPEVLSFVKRVQSDRLKLKTAIDDLFHLQWKNELSIEGKEALIRLLFIDSSLERGLRLIDSSLADGEDGITSSDILHMNLAEDEKSKMKSSVVSKVQDVNADHAALLAPVASGSLPLSRSQSLTNLNNLNKEEGSVLKLLNIERSGTGVFDLFIPYSGEEIRRKLLDVNLNDLNSVIAYLNKAKDKGFSLRELFNQSKGETSTEDHTMLDEIRKKLDVLIDTIPHNEKLEERESVADFGVEDSSDNTKAPEEDILRTYDKLLDKFNR